ncbi:DUF1456 family protein [Cellulophaga sp. Hel_I_12]|uniref:DUF1456 family protein n=1 Tax=Cellulophaga sp. Hel_I_12 TaxID=1249972 RepID=UPI0006458A01|nr:DUF1456 family protein [Cellulophaga sp. Hel_I_12]
MTNNDVLKKLRVALMLRDDEIVEILTLVDFKISKAELGAFFRKEDHPNYMECGDQILRNFLNGLVIHFRGTKENPKDTDITLAKFKKTPTAASKKSNPSASKKIAPTKKRYDPDFKAKQQKKVDKNVVHGTYKNKKK